MPVLEANEPIFPQKQRRLTPKRASCHQKIGSSRAPKKCQGSNSEFQVENNSEYDTEKKNPKISQTKHQV
jgi:hypothetical protein